MFSFGKTVRNITSNGFQHNPPVTIRINNRTFRTNLIFAASLSNKIEELVRLDATITFFEFYCFIQDPNTYDVLKSIFNGSPNQIPMKDQVVQDIFVVGKEMKCDDMISLFVERCNLQTIDMSNLDDHILYSKYLGYSPQFVEFVASNIFEIQVSKCIEMFTELGYDFAESVFKICQQKGININNQVISLIESNLIYVDLIKFVSNNNLDMEKMVRITHLLSNSLRNLNDSSNEILNFYSDTIERQVNEYTNFRTKNSNLQKENDRMRNENADLRNQISNLQSISVDLRNQVSNLQSKIFRLSIPKIKRSVLHEQFGLNAV